MRIVSLEEHLTVSPGIAGGAHHCRRGIGGSGRLLRTMFFEGNRAAFAAKPGEVGCYASHLKTMKIIVERDLDYALVLEDDAILPADSPRRSVAQGAGRGCRRGWDLVHICRDTNRAVKPVARSRPRPPHRAAIRAYPRRPPPISSAGRAPRSSSSRSRDIGRSNRLPPAMAVWGLRSTASTPRIIRPNGTLCVGHPWPRQPLAPPPRGWPIPSRHIAGPAIRCTRLKASSSISRSWGRRRGCFARCTIHCYVSLRRWDDGPSWRKLASEGLSGRLVSSLAER